MQNTKLSSILIVSLLASLGMGVYIANGDSCFTTTVTLLIKTKGDKDNG